MFKKYSKHYDKLNHDKPYRKEIDFVYEWGMKPKTVLDIGCGTASYWQYFPEDVQLVGLDMQRRMIEKSPHRCKIAFGNATAIAQNQALVAQISKIATHGKVDMAVALFDVINYVESHDWWKDIPLKKKGYFIFDVLDKAKARREGFSITTKKIGSVVRTIYPLELGNKVLLTIKVEERDRKYIEDHTMYLYSERDLRHFCDNKFEIVDKKETETWQTFYKLRRV